MDNRPSGETIISMRVKASTVVSWVVTLGIAGYVIYWSQPDQIDARHARLILGDTLKSPSTAQYVSIESIDRKDNWRFERVVVDSQNEFGAMVRSQICLVWHEDGDRIKWNKADGIQLDCPNMPGRELVDSIERLNGWPGK